MRRGESERRWKTSPKGGGRRVLAWSARRIRVRVQFRFDPLVEHAGRQNPTSTCSTDAQWVEAMQTVPSEYFRRRTIDNDMVRITVVYTGLEFREASQLFSLHHDQTACMGLVCRSVNYRRRTAADLGRTQSGGGKVFHLPSRCPQREVVMASVVGLSTMTTRPEIVGLSDVHRRIASEHMKRRRHFWPLSNLCCPGVSSPTCECRK